MKHREVGQREGVERCLDEAVAVDHGAAVAAAAEVAFAAAADAAADAARCRRRLREGRWRRRKGMLGDPAASSGSVQLKLWACYLIYLCSAKRLVNVLFILLQRL